MRIVKLLLAIVLAFIVGLPITTEATTSMEKVDLIPEFDFENHSLFPDNIAITSKGNIMAIEQVWDTELYVVVKKLVEYNKNGELEREVIIGEDNAPDAAFLVENLNGELLILLLDYEQQTLTRLTTKTL